MKNVSVLTCIFLLKFFDLCMPHPFLFLATSPILSLSSFLSVCLVFMPVLPHLPGAPGSAQTLHLLPHCVGSVLALRASIILSSAHLRGYRTYTAAFHSSSVSPGGRGGPCAVLLDSDLAYFRCQF